MGKFLAMSGMCSAAGVIYYLWLNARRQNVARLRFDRTLVAAELAAAELVDEPPPARPFNRRHLLLPWLVGAALAGVLWSATAIGSTYSLTAWLVVALIGWQLEAMLAERRMSKIEVQLADAIDLMVGALRAGAGLTGALDSAVRESREPLASQLDEVTGRIRFGDAPQVVFRGLAERVRLETFLLFTTALSVHWEVGGSLAPTLATVGRTIRDRIELSRRIRAMTTQARVSIIAVLGVTYFIAALMWTNDPDRMCDFLTTDVGSFLVAGAVLLQALGIVWSAFISRSKF